MPMPTFLVLGVAKAGTTSLYHYLKQHPQIYMSPKKEPHFFSFGEAPLPSFTGPGAAGVQERVVATLPAYQALFADWRTEIAGGEVSTSNFMARGCMRIQHYVPNARLILLLRQPAERAYSQFLHGRRTGWEPYTDFAQALAAEPSRIRQNWLPALCYSLPGFYAPTLQQYLTSFPKEQLRVYLYEEWQAQPLRILQEIFQLIGVDDQFVPDIAVRYNTAAVPRSRRLLQILRSPHFLKRLLKPFLGATLRQQISHTLTTFNVAKPPPLDPTVRAGLMARYREDILHVQELLQRDLSHWLATDPTQEQVTIAQTTSGQRLAA